MTIFEFSTSYVDVKSATAEEYQRWAEESGDQTSCLLPKSVNDFKLKFGVDEVLAD